MKTKIFTFLIIQLLFIIPIYAQINELEIEWDKKYENSDLSLSRINTIIQTNDNNYLISGTCMQFSGNTNKDIIVLKVNKNGDQIWKKIFASTGNDESKSITQTNDGNYIIVGYTGHGQGNENMWIIKINNQGDKIWDKIIDGDWYDRANSIISTSDGNLIVGYKSNSQHIHKIYILNIDLNGNIIWEKYLDTENVQSEANFITSTNNGDYLIAGFTRKQGKKHTHIIKIDNKGNKIWEKTYNGLTANSVIKTNDNNFIVVGNTENNTKWVNAWILKINNEGNVIWENNFGDENNYEDAKSIVCVSTNKYLVVGNSQTRQSVYNSWILEIDNSGNITSNKYYNNSNANFILKTYNSDFIVAGEKNGFGLIANLVKYNYKESANTKPIIIITTPTSQTTQNSQFTIQGTVTDDTGIKEFKINNNPVNLNGSNFSYTTQLSSGQNILNLVATDNNGNTSTKQITITKTNTQTDKIPPTVVITNPDISRGFTIIKNEMQYTIKGKATDASGIIQVLINNEEAYVDATGNFRKTINLAFGKNNFTVTATDKYNNISTPINFTITRNSQNQVVIDNDDINNVGKYYALVIGISEYTDPNIPDLNNEPTNDATELKNILTTDYTFEEQNVTLLLNPTNSEIIRNFDDLNKIITEKDNLLIFYAGHGYYDTINEIGYWLPSNAEKDYTDKWIYNDVLVANIKKIKSKHTLLISDACFSGSIFRDANINITDLSFQKKYELKSRNAITSGTLKTVPNKSVFFKYLSEYLRNNSDKYMSASQLFGKIEIPVTRNSPNIPQFGDIQNVDDRGGDFIFIRRDK